VHSVVKNTHSTYPIQKTPLFGTFGLLFLCWSLYWISDVKKHITFVEDQSSNEHSYKVDFKVRSLDLTTHTSLSPIWRGFTPSFVNYKKGCTRLAATSDKVYQLLARGRWFSPGTLASSTTKTGRVNRGENRSTRI
jgi:hypothetical protein